MSRRLPRWTVALFVASSLGLAACSSSASSPSPPAPMASTTTTTTVPPVTVPAADLSPAGTSGTAPTVVVPPGAPPTTLESSDLIMGSGATAKPGDTVTVQYVLATYSTGKQIQSSWTSGPAGFSFTLDADPEQVIPGWDQGVAGMKVGGRRELIIPPALGYGASVPPGSTGIAANDTLVFIVDLLKVN